MQSESATFVFHNMLIFGLLHNICQPVDFWAEIFTVDQNSFKSILGNMTKSRPALHLERAEWCGLIKRAFSNRFDVNSRFRIIWVCGPRWLGKTKAVVDLPGHYVDCEDPSNWRQLSDPERFAREANKRVVLDEIDALPEPALVLTALVKQPVMGVLAVSSSSRFPTGLPEALKSKVLTLELPPPLWSECAQMDSIPPERLLTIGTFPKVLVGGMPLSDYYLQWADTSFARDLQKQCEWKGVGDFLRFFNAVAQRSGGLRPLDYRHPAGGAPPSSTAPLEYGPLNLQDLARAGGATHRAVEKRLRVLEECCLLVRVSPLKSEWGSDLAHGAKPYVFNPGLVCLARSWSKPTEEAYEVLWRHVVLWHLRAFLPSAKVHYWERKDRRRKIDFALEMPGGGLHAFKCAWRWDDDTADFEAFRQRFPRNPGWNCIVTNSKNEAELVMKDQTSIMVRDLVELEHLCDQLPGSLKNSLGPIDHPGLRIQDEWR